MRSGLECLSFRALIEIMRSILLLFILSFALRAEATHIVGGELYYRFLGEDDYEVTLIIYRDCGPTNTNGTYFDALASVGVYRDGILFSNLQMNLNNAEIDELPVAVDNPCFIVPPDVCVERAIYTETINLPAWPSGYTLTHQRCCRNPSIINIQLPEESGATFWTQVPGTDLVTQNSNPVFSSLPPVALCANDFFEFDHAANDVDGDSLVYTFCTPLLGGSFFEPTPNPPPPAPYTPIAWETGFDQFNQITSDPQFTIDPVTGWMSGTPTAPGQYVIGVCVEEYRNGVLLSSTNRDFQFNVQACGLSTVSAIQGSEPCSGLDIPFGNNSFGGEAYYWDFGVTGIDTDISTEFEPEYTYPDTGTYEVILIVNPGTECADTSYQTIYAYDPLFAEFSINGGECASGGREYNVQAMGDYPDYVDFFWGFGASSSPASSNLLDPGSFIAGEAGTLTVDFFVTHTGCEASYSIPIEIDPFPIAAIEAQSVFCAGLELPFTNASSYAENFFWNFGHSGLNATSSQTDPVHTFPEYESYVITLIAEPGTACADTTQTEVDILSTDPIELQYSVSIPGPCDSNPSVNLLFSGTGADDIEWMMGDGTSYTSDAVEHYYEENGSYTLTLIAYNELCNVEETATQIITFDTDVIDLPLKIPNVFSPNNDGKNDTYRPFFEGEDGHVFTAFPAERSLFDYLAIWEVQIYNRWGALVYEGSGQGGVWDGKIEGENALEGTYYAIVHYQRRCVDPAPIILSLSFSLLR